VFMFALYQASVLRTMLKAKIHVIDDILIVFKLIVPW